MLNFNKKKFYVMLADIAKKKKTEMMIQQRFEDAAHYLDKEKKYLKKAGILPKNSFEETESETESEVTIYCYKKIR